MDTYLLKSIGQKINMVRTDLKYTQKDLADLIGVSQQLISIYEKGENAIRVDLLAEIAKACNVSLYYFFAESEENEQLVRLVESLHPGYREFGLQQIRELIELQYTLMNGVNPFNYNSIYSKKESLDQR